MSPHQGTAVEGGLSGLLGWNMYCLAEFEFLDQLGWGLLLQEGGVASFLAPGRVSLMPPTNNSMPQYLRVPG